MLTSSDVFMHDTQGVMQQLQNRLKLQMMNIPGVLPMHHNSV